ncbi:putative baseplate assembly protein [Streptomyces roseolilacinus]|uniref:Baseplate assembly protein n=1 Tax=Streptomyces roseolilacinus TaxID=66904 RepID=A0A918B0J9_9ACTN|nr:putative baseplate assembly protein [Streptomyces roseolilacinus]GGQ08544.1 putative baseplate assembly protein [Streptomyces roseolilacinus]
MTLPVPRLDDLTWADMMAAVRRRVPAESDGTWTLHAPVDPGVTLLELFAYLLEQRLYWLDQLPDALVVAVLRLLGLDPPRPARPAATVLRLTARRAGTAVPVVPAGTALTRDPAGRVVFTLDDGVAVFPLAEDAQPTVWTDRDRTADLQARRGVPLLAADGAPARARFTLPLTGAHPAPGPLSLLFELDAPAAAAPSWLPGAVADVPPPAELTWSWFRPGTDLCGPFEEVEDGTAGLRRSGVVRLHPPSGWTTRDSGVLVSTPAATHAAPPRLLQLAVNVSAARHLRRRTAPAGELREQIDAWLKLPGQRLVLPEAAERLVEASLRLAGEEWRPVPDFAFGGPADRIFVLDRAEGAVVFGDGLTGRVPRPGGDASVEYAVGGGRDGNGGTTANWVPAEESPAAVTAANLVRAEGGAEPETVAEARRRAAASLGEVTRAVTADDFVTLARTTPGVAVARAHASLGEHPGFPCSPVPGAVTVHLVPAVPRDDPDREDFVAAPHPDPGTLCAVAARLEQARLLTSEVFVRAPRYRDVAVRADLSGDPADRARVSAVLTGALRRFLDPLVGGGGRDGWPFGEPLRPSALLRAAQQALGDLANVSAVAIGLDGADPDEDCREVPIGPGDLPVLRAVRTRIVSAVEPGEGLA